MGLSPSRRLKSGGAVLFETLLIVSLCAGVFFAEHLVLVKAWREELVELQKERISYDGVKTWSQKTPSEKN